MERPAHSPLRCSAWSYGQGLTTTSWIRAIVPSAWAAEALSEPGMESCGADARRDAIVIGRQLGVALLEHVQPLGSPLYGVVRSVELVLPLPNAARSRIGLVEPLVEPLGEPYISLVVLQVSVVALLEELGR